MWVWGFGVGADRSPGPHGRPVMRFDWKAATPGVRCPDNSLYSCGEFIEI